MKSVITNLQLFHLRADINKQIAASMAFHVFNRQKIQDFFKLNAIHLGVMDQKVQQLITRHVKHDEEGKPMHAEDKYIFEKPEDEKNYLTDFNELMARNCTVHT